MSDEVLKSEDLSDAAVPPSADDWAALAAERDRLAGEKADLEQRLLRRAAEFDNHRKRTERELQEMREYAATESVKAMLPILDDFERALRVETVDPGYAAGVELIYNRFLDQLKKLGLEPIDAAGMPFDPYVHNAIEMVPTTEAEDHTVLADLQRGYNFKGRLLRPSMVRVAVHPPAADPSSEQ